MYCIKPKGYIQHNPGCEISKTWLGIFTNIFNPSTQISMNSRRAPIVRPCLNKTKKKFFKSTNLSLSLPPSLFVFTPSFYTFPSFSFLSVFLCPLFLCIYSLLSPSSHSPNKLHFILEKKKSTNLKPWWFTVIPGG